VDKTIFYEELIK